MEGKKLLEVMPRMLSGTELQESLQIIPPYHESIRDEPSTVRLMELSELYKLYIPSPMSFEIYSKLYLALLRSLQKKDTHEAIRQRYENHKAIQRQEYRGIMGGSDSFTIIGTSGIGKSSAISRAISLITENRIIELDTPKTKIIPCLIVQCPFDSSVKGMLLEILRKVDEEIGTSYYHNAVKSRAATTDMLIGSVSTIALNHIGMLIVDEIQNVVNSKNGKTLIGALTQLINNSGISIGMVGTPECIEFFSQAMQLARRSMGLQYTSVPYDAYFEQFCGVIFQYQYVKHHTELTPAITEWLYEHSGGVISVVVSLIHDAQEIAILNGREALDIESLNEAYKQRLSFLHDYIQPKVTQRKQTAKVQAPSAKVKPKTVTTAQQSAAPMKSELPAIKPSLAELADQSKATGQDIVMILKDYYSITEVAV